MKQLSIRWRLTLWYGGALVIVLTAFCVVLLILTRQLLLARTDAGLQEELQELALEAKLAQSPDDFLQHVRERFYQLDDYDFLMTNSRGEILFASDRLTPEQAKSLIPVSTSDELEFSSREFVKGRFFRFAGLTVNGPQEIVTLQAMTSLSSMYADLLVLELVMIGLLPLGVIFALAGGYFLAQRALAPVDQIARVAETISISNLHQRIDIGNTSDEIGRLASTLNSLIARLERAVEEIQRFTADASHELRTPLAVLRSEAECALRRRRTPEEYQTTLMTIVDEATRLGRLADQLLDLSRLDAGIIGCRHDPVRVDALLLDIVEQLRTLAKDKGVSLNAAAMTPCEVPGDDLQLRQALFNIVENGVKYTPSGGSVTIRGDVRENTAVLEIRDTGIGIPPEQLSKVFDRFYRVDSSRNSATGGTGLGLSITRSTIQLHGGDVTIESEERVGTQVTIRFPGAVALLNGNPSVGSESPHETSGELISVDS